jgi:hypothetical protein
VADKPRPAPNPRPYPSKEVAGTIEAALRDAPRGRRHPAEVTSDRLGDATTHWGALFTGPELDMIGQIRHALEEIATGERRSDV